MVPDEGLSEPVTEIAPLSLIELAAYRPVTSTFAAPLKLMPLLERSVQLGSWMVYAPGPNDMPLVTVVLSESRHGWPPPPAVATISPHAEAVTVTEPSALKILANTSGTFSVTVTLMAVSLALLTPLTTAAVTLPLGMPLTTATLDAAVTALVLLLVWL